MTLNSNPARKLTAAANRAAAKAAKAALAAKAAPIHAQLGPVLDSLVQSARAGIRNDRDAMANDVAAMQACAKDKAASARFRDLFLLACIAEILSYPDGAEGLMMADALRARLKPGQTRTQEETDALGAAAARLSRRLKAAGLESLSTRGRKRADKPAKPAKPAAANKPAKPAKPATVPALDNMDDWAAYLQPILAQLQTARRKGAKGATVKLRNPLDAFLRDTKAAFA